MYRDAQPETVVPIDALENLRYRREGPLARIVLARPDRLNAIDRRTLDELWAISEEIERDRGVRVALIQAEGRAFCAGADLKSVQGMLAADHWAFAAFIRWWQKVFAAIETLRVPTIAAVHGMALAGGLELTQVCDFVIAAEDAVLGDQHSNFGLLPGGGATARLPRLIGVRRAKELILTGNRWDARTAERCGLVNAVAPAVDLLTVAEQWAATLAERSPRGTQAAKRLIHHGSQVDLASALELEMNTLFSYFTSADVREGLQAFAERRQPVFRDS